MLVLSGGDGVTRVDGNGGDGLCVWVKEQK